MNYLDDILAIELLKHYKKILERLSQTVAFDAVLETLKEDFFSYDVELTTLYCRGHSIKLNLSSLGGNHKNGNNPY